MARFAFGPGMANYVYLDDIYDDAHLALTAKTASTMVFRDPSGAIIRLSGSGFKYNGSTPTAGTVTKVEFVDAAGIALVAVTQGSFDLYELSLRLQGWTDATTGQSREGSVYDLLSVLSRGNDAIHGTAAAEDFAIGTNYGDDRIFARGGDDYIRGGSGNNTINGGAGWDTLSYSDSLYDAPAVLQGIVLNAATGTVTNPWGGTDTISNIEDFVGTHLADRLTGSAADEQFMGLAGADTINGGAGYDWLRYDSDRRYGGDNGIAANLTAGRIRDGFGHVDTVSGIEEVRGTIHNDRFIGSDKSDTFEGLAGKDFYDGKGGADVFDFRAPEEAGIGASRDVIANFSRAEGDRIDVGDMSAFDFKFRGTAAFSGDHPEVRYVHAGGNTIVAGDVDEDGKADFQIELRGIIDLKAWDFIL
ncbi:hypothetical protein MRS76_04430 [Rhizobiaceae bacterium n13]|uniref:Peptidase M10 serralysin C-terminal domain-containing protein n=1 Tax=Ferirhizobium litorale TaxID=2927786 RepID=A0AAE3QAD8_9HYPH|nr:calcium-binding protein [Fererhizobium litorale]MDI7861193.1 hypothetical protein [Fererhizobium litorale]MDI7921340.1 hypothetical protein [Fererhizobium litorale]